LRILAQHHTTRSLTFLPEEDTKTKTRARSVTGQLYTMRKLLIVSLLALSLCSCQRSCAKWDKEHQTSARHYQVVMYSGGDTVFNDNFFGIINDAEGSDGCYYFKGDTLIEISGDYIIKSDK
jgi:hypothetical protein